jgi:hypothetical protein
MRATARGEPEVPMIARDRMPLAKLDLARMVLPLAAVMLAVCLAALAGCGGGSSGASPTPRVADHNGPAGKPPEAIVTQPGEVFNVTIYTSGGQLYVDKLEVEFNRRRGIHAFYGFYRDQYAEMATIPFSSLRRIDFDGQMPVGLFDQATIGREAMNLDRDYAFQVQLTYTDQRREEFFALIPKLRGERDFVLWEQTMNSTVKQIDYIEFDR